PARLCRQVRRLPAARDRVNGGGYCNFAPRQPARGPDGAARTHERLPVPDADAALRHRLPTGAPAGAQRNRPVARAVGARPTVADTAAGGARPRLVANRSGGHLHGSPETRPARLMPPSPPAEIAPSN